MPTDQIKLMSRKDVANVLSVHVDTVDRWADDGILPKPWVDVRHRTKRTRRWRACDIDDWLSKPVKEEI